MIISKSKLIALVKLICFLALLPALVYAKKDKKAIEEPKSIFSVIDHLRVPKKISQSYFPKRLFGRGENKLNPYCDNWYKRELILLEEPVIYTDTSQLEIYRFICIYSEIGPAAITIAKYGNQYALYWRVKKNDDPKDPDNIIANEKKLISEDDWNSFMKILSDMEYWQMPVQYSNNNGNDGSRWVLEGKKGNKYHIVDRWMPELFENTKKYYQCCKYLMDLTKMNFKWENQY